MSCIYGENRDIFFPKLNEKLNLTTFSEIACNYLTQLGYEPYECNNEEEARSIKEELINKKKWPCYFFKSDTTGEKDFEEFYTSKEKVDLERFEGIGIIKNKSTFDLNKLNFFIDGIESLRSKKAWEKNDILRLFFNVLPEFEHKETGKYLDQRM